MTEHQAPMVTVCIPTYNGAAHLEAALDSLQAQQYSDFEILVCDDGSSDDTLAVLERCQDPRLRVLRNPVNLGAQGNWNRCLEAARGRYIKLLPQDDSLAPECLARQVAVLESDEARREIALAFSARQVIGPDGRALMVRSYRRQGGRIAAAALMRQCLWRGTNAIGEPGCVLFRREQAAQVGGFNGSEPYVIDLDYWFRLLALGDAWYDAMPLATFRVSRGSWSVALGQRQGADFSRFLDRVAPRHGFSRLDLLRAGAMARLNGWLRRVFYRVLLP